MSRYHGAIGYAIEKEIKPGVWKEVIEEHFYYGDVVKNKTNYQQSSNVNTNITMSNNISIVADPFAHENFYSIRYAVYCGKKWSVTSIEINKPRMLLTLGGLYNER